MAIAWSFGLPALISVAMFSPITFWIYPSLAAFSGSRWLEVIGRDNQEAYRHDSNNHRSDDVQR